MRMRVCYNTIGKFGDLKKMKIKLNLGGFFDYMYFNQSK